MKKECLCNNTVSILVFPCSGSSNCGQIANRVAIKIAEDGVGAMSCLVGISADAPGMIESAKSAKSIVVIDGCAIGCAKKILERAGIAITDYIDIVQEGIANSQECKISQQDIFFIAKQVQQKLKKDK